MAIDRGVYAADGSLRVTVVTGTAYIEPAITFCLTLVGDTLALTLGQEQTSRGI